MCVSRAGSALPAGSSQFLLTQRGLSPAVRGVQTVPSSLQPVAIFLSASPVVLLPSVTLGIVLLVADILLPSGKEIMVNIVLQDLIIPAL